MITIHDEENPYLPNLNISWMEAQNTYKGVIIDESSIYIGSMDGSGYRHGKGEEYKECGWTEHTNYQHGVMHGHCVRYYEDGSKEEGEYIEFQQHGEWIRYNKDGSQKKTTYDHGEIVGGSKSGKKPQKNQECEIQ